MNLLFPLADYWHLYVWFIVLVCGLLLLDLGVFHRKAHAVSMKEAATWTVVWISLALLFNVGLYFYSLDKFEGHASGGAAIASQVGLEFLTGYIIEKALAVDNIFVFVVIFNFLAIPPKYQHRVLFYGILGALVFRAIFISIGAVLVQYHAVVILFGAFLILTGIKILFAPERKADLSDNPILKFLNRFLPVARELSEDKFFIRQAGRLMVTPLFVALVLVEFSDIIFAVDSVPAIFAITHEPFIVFTSNIFAILGLRSMYFLLAGSVDRFYLLKYALGIVLIFVGLKMVWLNELYGGKFPISWSLAFIVTLIAGSILFSCLRPRPTGDSTKLSA